MKDLISDLYRNILEAKENGKTFIRMRPIEMEEINDKELERLSDLLRDDEMSLGLIEDFRNGTVVLTVSWEK